MDRFAGRGDRRRPADPSRRRGMGALLGLLVGASLCWFLAPVMDSVFEPASRERLHWVPDSWLPGYDWLYDRTGRRLGLSVYWFWGRLTFLAYLLGVLGVTALPAGRLRMTRLGRRLLLIAFSVGSVADFSAYWGGTGRPATGTLPPAAQQSPPGEDLSAATAVGYGVEVLATLVVLVGLGLFGAGLVRERRRPVWSGWVLLAGAVLTVPIAYAGDVYYPHGVLLLVLIAMAVALVGHLVAGGRSEHSAPVR